MNFNNGFNLLNRFVFNRKYKSEGKFESNKRIFKRDIFNDFIIIIIRNSINLLSLIFNESFKLFYIRGKRFIKDRRGV